MNQNTQPENENLENKIHAILQTNFNFNQFRPGQAEAIMTLLQQGRLLCIQPTGHGKSLLYQLPALLLDGITIVISPLLALMRDQINHLNNRFKIPAASINSDQSDAENAHAQQLARKHAIKILFIAPEKLDHVDYFNFLFNLPVRLIVVDEAHCISTWGHDFRPSYRQIIHFIRAISEKNINLKVLAITATANQKTEEDIQHQLLLSNQPIAVQRQKMDRPNIHLTVIPIVGLAEKLALVMQLLKQLSGHGLIYCATRENTEMLAEYLQNNGVIAAAYHAGLDPETKRQLQQNFIANQYQVISATNALGMGIDKQDLRFIIHFDLPGSITAYYQEVGRCGRDGKLAQGILLFDEADRKIQNYFIDSAQPTLVDFKHVMDCIKQSTIAPTITEIKRISGFHPTRINVILAELIEQGFLAKKSQNRSQVYYLTDKHEKLNLSRYENQFRVRTFELDQMINYGNQQTMCLMASLRKALGDTEVEKCGHCSSCIPPLFSIQKAAHDVAKIQQWLNLRAPMISSSKKNLISEGVAVLDAQLRSPTFIKFMKSRATANTMNDRELLALIEQHLIRLQRKYSFSTVISIPSRTWLSRNHLAEFVSTFLKTDLLSDYLRWKKLPQSRQGELLNNDQRRFNVHQHMQINNQIKKPEGPLLLFDDYIGSGTTINEAARALRQEANLNNVIVPFTIATVKWRLGKRGMV